MKNISDIFLDTNILVHLTLTDFDVKKHQETRDVVSQLFSEKKRLLVSEQVLREFMAVVTNPRFLKKALSSETAVAQVAVFRDTFTLVATDSVVLDECLKLVADHGVVGARIHDAAIAATAIRHDIRHLLTYNIKDFSSFEKITPLAPSAF